MPKYIIHQIFSKYFSSVFLKISLGPGLFETVYMVIEVIDLFVEPGRDSLTLSRNYVGTGEEKTVYVPKTTRNHDFTYP